MKEKEQKRLVLKATTEDFSQLEVGDKVYLPSYTNVEYWTFLGFNPVHPNYAMLESSSDVTKIKVLYLDGKFMSNESYYTNSLKFQVLAILCGAMDADHVVNFSLDSEFFTRFMNEEPDLEMEDIVMAIKILVNEGFLDKK